MAVYKFRSNDEFIVNRKDSNNKWRSWKTYMSNMHDYFDYKPVDTEITKPIIYSPTNHAGVDYSPESDFITKIESDRIYFASDKDFKYFKKDDLITQGGLGVNKEQTSPTSGKILSSYPDADDSSIVTVIVDTVQVNIIDFVIGDSVTQSEYSGSTAPDGVITDIGPNFFIIKKSNTSGDWGPSNNATVKTVPTSFTPNAKITFTDASPIFETNVIGFTSYNERFSLDGRHTVVSTGRIVVPPVDITDVIVIMSNFESQKGDKPFHKKTYIQVTKFDDISFNKKVIDSVTKGDFLTEWVLPEENLEIGQHYRMRCRYESNDGAKSDWSDVIDFVTS